MSMIEFSLSRAIIKSKYTAVLTAGAVIGVMCLIVITSLFNNYYLTSENIFMGIHPHICIRKEGMNGNEAKNLIQRLKNKFPGIEKAAPALYTQVNAVISRVNKEKFFCVHPYPLERTVNTVESPTPGRNIKNQKTNTVSSPLECFDPGRFKPGMKLFPRYGFTITNKKEQRILLKGISVENDETVSGIKKIINGMTRLDDLERNQDENGNPLPWSFYMQEDLFPGAIGLKDFLFSFPGISNEAGTGSGRKNYHCLQKGTLAMGTKKEQYPLVVMSLENARQCLGQPGAANTIEMQLAAPYQAEKMAAGIRRLLGKEFSVESWIQHSRSSFAFLGIIKIMILAIIFSISIVAAIGMVSTLTLIVMQNRSKIAILKSMGLKNSGIYKIFIFNTALTGLTGVAAGTGLGLSAAHLTIHFLSDSLAKLGIKDPQVLIHPQEVFIISLAVIVMFILTAIVPSRHAIAADVVQGLQEQ